MTLWETFAAYPALFIASTAVFGLMVGSFLNVVILRLPVMMEREWRAQCAEPPKQMPGQMADQPPPANEPFNLVQPRSRCPHCGHAIGALENIPVLSYLALGGRCAACRAPIGARYPAVELFTGLAAALVAWRFGSGWEAAAALLFTFFLIALAGIDLDHKLLPDNLNYLLLWLGLAASLVPVFVDARAAIIGALAGYLSLWLVFHGFRLATGKEGMGYGDFKLFAALGAWLGWQQLPLVILLAAGVGALVGLTLMALKRADRATQIPFGPYLAAAGWIALLWGEAITGRYLALLH
jgi:leader peptidase (prepilin peptidase)/N-methyltransferase